MKWINCKDRLPIDGKIHFVKEMPSQSKWMWHAIKMERVSEQGIDVLWLDESEESDQDILWNAVESVIDQDLRDEYGAYSISITAMQFLKSKYYITPK